MATAWVLADHTGKAATPIENAAQRKFTAKRNQGRQGEITLTHDDQEAGELLDLLRNGVPQLRYIRDGALRLSGYLTSIDEAIGEDGEDHLVAVFKDPYGRMLGDGQSGRIITADTAFTQRDQGLIGGDLITAANAARDTGLRVGEVALTVLRDRAYTAGKNIGEAIRQLTEVLGGFDFEILPLDPTKNAGKLGEYVGYARQGQDRPDLIWGFGAPTMANVRKVERKLTAPVNRVRMLTSDGLVADVSDAVSIGRYGEWAAGLAAPSDITDPATLERHARDRLRPEWTRVLKFAPDPDLDPRPFDDYWLGDTGRFKADQGYFADVFSPTVNAVTITQGPDDDETIELELEAVE